MPRAPALATVTATFEPALRTASAAERAEPNAAEPALPAVWAAPAAAAPIPAAAAPTPLRPSNIHIAPAVINPAASGLSRIAALRSSTRPDRFQCSCALIGRAPWRFGCRAGP